MSAGTLNEAAQKYGALNGAKKLDIGAGSQWAREQSDEWLALDIVSTFRPDVLGDAHRLPFADGSLKAIKCHHVLEHIPRDYFVFHWAGQDSYIEARKGLVDVMNEMWRVLAVGGQVWLEYPLFPTEEAIADPTHGSFLTSNTLDYFTLCEQHTDDMAHLFTCREEHRQMYGCKPWRLVRRERVNHGRVLVAFMEKLAG
jgi:hypothetical protein